MWLPKELHAQHGAKVSLDVEFCTKVFGKTTYGNTSLGEINRDNLLRTALDPDRAATDTVQRRGRQVPSASDLHGEEHFGERGGLRVIRQRSLGAMATHIDLETSSMQGESCAGLEPGVAKEAGAGKI